MSVNMDYSYLFEQMFGVSNVAKSVASGGNMVKMSDLSSPSVQAQLKAAGIDTNSKQYQTALKSMMTAGRGGGYFTIQGIKNRMQYYDADGDHINQAFGVSGLTVTDKNIASKNRIISIPDSVKDDMFELTKKEFLQENGAANGETTRRSDIYRKMYQFMVFRQIWEAQYLKRSSVLVSEDACICNGKVWNDSQRRRYANGRK